jgi:hypothetical protein
MVCALNTQTPFATIPHKAIGGLASHLALHRELDHLHGRRRLSQRTQIVRHDAELRNTVASLKSPVAGSPVRLNATAPTWLHRTVAALQRIRCSFQGTGNFDLRQVRRVLSFADREWGRFQNHWIFQNR